MEKLQVVNRYSMINDLCSSIRDRVDSIFEEICDKDFEISDEENAEYMKIIKYNVETLERYL